MEVPEFKSKRHIDKLPIRYGCSIDKCEFSEEYYLSKKYVIDIDYEKRKVFYLSSKDKSIINVPCSNCNLQKDNISSMYIFGNKNFLNCCTIVIYIHNNTLMYELDLMRNLINEEYILFGLVDDDDINEKYSKCEFTEI